MKKALLSLMLICFAFLGVARAQTTVEIGDGTSAYYYTPIGTLYNYSITEMLYTAEEIGMAGSIQSISFYYAVATAKDFPIEVYMANVDATDLSTGISLADADLVFSGTYSVTEAGWATITLDSPFAYDGTSNLLIGVNKGYVYWYSGNTWNYTSATNMARYSQNDNNAYTTNDVPGTATPYRANIQIDITPGSGPICEKPETLEVSEVTGATAALTWTGGSGTYNVEYKLSSATEWTSAVANTTSTSYTLTGLQPGKPYNARVQSVCSDGTSGWKTANFNTECEVITTFPWNEGFEDYTTGDFTNPCWVNEHISGGGTYIFKIYSSTSGLGGNTTQLLQLPDMSEGTLTKLVLPEMTLPTNNYQFVINVYRNDSYSSKVDEGIRVYASANGEIEGATELAFIPRVYTVSNNIIPAEAANGWYEYILPIGMSGTCYIILQGESKYGTSTYMDNFVVEEAPACPKPIGLAVNYEGGNTATVSWTSTATSFNLDVNGTVINNVTTSSYTLNDLELATEYQVMVQANCGADGTSEWTNPVSFTTDLCLPEDMCDLTIELTDSYGDGWNGAYLGVYDYSTTELLAQYTLSTGSTGTQTLSVCDGRVLAFVWSAGSYDSETSFVVYDPVGDAVVSAEGGFSGAIGYTMECAPTCRTPQNFTVISGPGSAKFSWNELGESTAWVLQYMAEDDEDVTEVTVDTNPFTLTGLAANTYYARLAGEGCEKWSTVVSFTVEACPKPDLTLQPYPFSATLDWTDWGSDYELDWAEAPAAKDGGIWLQYDDDTHYTNIGNTTNAWRTWGVRYTKNDIQGNTTLTKVAFMESSYYSDTTSCIIRVYSGEEQPTTLLGTENVTANGTSGWHEVTLSTPITISPVENLWITLSVYGGYVMVACQVNNPDNQWWDDNADGEWTNMGEDNSNLADYGWMIRGYVEGYNDMLWGWTSETGVTPPYELENLEPETNYVVRMRANCGADGESDWVWIYFTTPSACDAPIELQAEATSNGANLSWIGYQDDYELRYREATKYIPVWEDDFEDGLDNWTIVAGDEATYPSGGIWYTINPVSGLEFAAYSGTYCASSWSWNTDPYNADNWLISPQLDLQGALKFYVRTNAGYPDSYEVLLSTTTNDVADFTIELQAYAPAPDVAKWNEVIIDLSAYEGQQGYIAIHHEDYDENYLLIDKFGIYNIIEASDWQVESLSETNFQLTGLTASTDYEWQVRGENRDCDEGEEDGFTDWSELATFTTLEAQGQTIALAAGANYVSFYVETTLNGVETALTDALGTTGVSMSIKSQTEYTEFKRGHWTTEIAFDVTQLFIISVSADCEIVVSGPAINPAEHEITIVQGANWISYPNAAPMLITPAFTGFVMPNDEITSQTDYAKFTRGKWTNEAMQLQPGQGYIYGSQQTGDRPFTFPTPAKVAPKSVSNGPAVQRMPRTTEMY